MEYGISHVPISAFGIKVKHVIKISHVPWFKVRLKRARVTILELHFLINLPEMNRVVGICSALPHEDICIPKT